MYSIVLALLKHWSIFYMSYCKTWYQYLFLTRAHFLYNFLKHSHIFATEKRSDVYSLHSISYLLMSIHPPSLLLGQCNLLLKYGYGILITEIISKVSIAIYTHKINQKWRNTLKIQSVKLIWGLIKVCWRSLSFTIAFLWEHLKKGAPKELCASGR